MVGVPAMYVLLSQGLAEKQVRHKNFRLCISGGGYLPPDKLNRLEELLDIPILETYGTTESLFTASCNYLHGPRKNGSIGYPLPEVEMKIVDEAGKTLSAPDVGEIAIKGGNIAPEYCHKPEKTDVSIKNGWLFTGDIGYMDGEGFFHFLDRKEDVIEKGGFHVYPREVEDCILEQNDVIEAAVIGIKDPQSGEEVKGCVVLKEGSELTAKDIIERCRTRLPFYKCPKEIAFYKELPKGPSGRILKRVLRAGQRGEYGFPVQDTQDSTVSDSQ
jgi:long-chain acyl-CoA synthetase